MTLMSTTVPTWGLSIFGEEVSASPAASSDSSVSTVSSGATSFDGVILDVLEADAVSELMSYLRLPAGWDGYGGDRFASETVGRAMEVAMWGAEYFRSRGIVPDALTPGPAGDGSIDIEITLGGTYLLFTLQPDSDICSVCFGGVGAEEIEESCSFEQSAVEHWFERIVPPNTSKTTVVAA